MERLSEEAERLSEGAVLLRRGGAFPFLARKEPSAEEGAFCGRRSLLRKGEKIISGGHRQNLVSDSANVILTE